MPLENVFRLALSDEFLDAYSQLPRRVQGNVSKFITQFRNNPTSSGLNYELIRNSKNKNMRSVRINQEYRAIVLKPEVGNTYLILWVDHHDEAYAWAQRKTCIVNEGSGALQIIDVEAVETTTAQFEQKNTSQERDRFHHIRDKHLMKLGVPEILLPALRKVITDEDVDAILPHLPPEASDAILMLASGYELDDVFRSLEKSATTEEKIDPNNLDQALTNFDTLSRFTVITDDAELEEMLAAPLEKWRVFLHPSQRKLINRDWNGAVRVLGGAGTGKTVVAMHRAKWLIQNYLKDSLDRVLFTTFTRNLATDIEANMKTICSPEVMRRIKVINLDAWVTQFFKKEGITFRIAYEETEEKWQQAYEIAPDIGLNLSFYQDEWNDVIAAQSCQTERDYLKARRIGRGTRLSRQQRKEIWPVFEEYRRLLLIHNLREPDDAFQEAAKIIENKGNDFVPFRAVIVDEAQDMSPAAFKLLRAIAGTPHKNDLFIVGDAHQRIYGKTVILSHCGISIRGRSKKLRLNYRTTDEIRHWAASILQGESIDDLDGGADSLNDYRSLIHGNEPLINGFDTFDQEVNFLVETLNQIQEEEQSLVGVCVVLRTKANIDKLKKILEKHRIISQEIKPEESDQTMPEGVRLSTMHRVKGLQFNDILIPFLDKNSMPLKSVLMRCADETSRDNCLLRERCLLHVAATRAKRRVFISYHGQPSPFIV